MLARAARRQESRVSPKAVLEFAAKNDARQVDLRFYRTCAWACNITVTYPINQLDEASFEEGFGMDGSSIRGWAAIHESDSSPICDHYERGGTPARSHALWRIRSIDRWSGSKRLAVYTRAFLDYEAPIREKGVVSGTMATVRVGATRCSQGAIWRKDMILQSRHR